MALILDTDNEIFIARDAASVTQHLLGLLVGEPDDGTLARRTATVRGCDVPDVIITRAERLETHPVVHHATEVAQRNFGPNPKSK